MAAPRLGARSVKAFEAKESKRDMDDDRGDEIEWSLRALRLEVGSQWRGKDAQSKIRGLRNSSVNRRNRIRAGASVLRPDKPGDDDRGVF